MLKIERGGQNLKLILYKDEIFFVYRRRGVSGIYDSMTVLAEEGGQNMTVDDLNLKTSSPKNPYVRQYNFVGPNIGAEMGNNLRHR